MPSFPELQRDFRAALGTGAPPAGVTAVAPEETARRFAVYRNNVAVALIEALRRRFPVVERLVGTDFARAMFAAFAQAHPPRSPLMLAYGEELPDFIAAFPPAAGLPYLPDVARLELARGRAYHAADAEPLGAAELAAAAARDPAELRLRLHPSLEVITSRHPVHTIWAMNQPGATPGPIADWRAESVLVARPRLAVVTVPVPPGEAALRRRPRRRGEPRRGGGAGWRRGGRLRPRPGARPALRRRAGGRGRMTLSPVERGETPVKATTPAATAGARDLLRRINGLLGRTPYCRGGARRPRLPAAVFWMSGQTKVDGFAIRESTFFLFANDFKLPFIAPVPAAYLTTIAEHLFPVLLVIGLFTRLSALALLGMTLVIEIFVFPDAWVTHGLWATAFLILIARGPGALSLDRLIGIEPRGDAAGG